MGDGLVLADWFLLIEYIISPFKRDFKENKISLSSPAPRFIGVFMRRGVIYGADLEENRPDIASIVLEFWRDKALYNLPYMTGRKG
ncbi:MAG TPA: hypothetical protein PLE24_10410 [Chitinispirillaceae bacterium]|nr:hypothetical protein [Chitinispirillaceae bacterium]